MDRHRTGAYRGDRVKFANRVKNVIFSPRDAFQNILAEGFSMTEPLAVILGMSFLNIVLFGIGVVRGMSFIEDLFLGRIYVYPDFGEIQINFSGYSALLLTFFLGIAIFFTILSLFSWIVNAGVAHIVAKHIFHGLGDFESILCTYGYSEIASISLTLGLLIFIFSPVIGIFAILGMKIAEFIWRIVLRTLAVSEVYGLDLGRSFLCAITPYLLISAFCLIMILVSCTI